MRPPGLNHVYVVLDAEIFAAVRDSAELRELLGRSDGGLPDYAAPAAGADRVFFRGRSTYLELFAPDNRFGEPVGKVGIAVGVDDRPAFERLSAAWQARCGAGFRADPVVYRRVEPAVPWYDAVQCDETATGPGLAIWAMVYRPEFARWQTGGDDLARARILAPRQGRFEVEALTLDVAAGDLERIAGQLASAGFERTETAEGTRLAGGGWTLTLRRADVAPGLRSMTLAVDRAEPARLALGSARIERIDPGRVLLRFALEGRAPTRD